MENNNESINLRFTIGPEMFRQLVKGIEIKIQQADTTWIAFQLDPTLTWKEMVKMIADGVTAK